MQTTFPIYQDSLSTPMRAAQTLAGRTLLAIAASGLVALSAHISVPLYFTPIPLTLQTLAVIWIGLTLGPVLGASAMVLYLIEGAVGLPVFSPLGAPGVTRLIGPAAVSAGFLFSYPFAAAASGLVVRAIPNPRFQIPAALLGGTVASLFIFTMGPIWMAHLLHLGPHATWNLAIAPFVPGEALKLIAAASIFSALRHWRHF